MMIALTLATLTLVNLRNYLNKLTLTVINLLRNYLSELTLVNHLMDYLNKLTLNLS